MWSVKDRSDSMLDPTWRIRSGGWIYSTVFIKQEWDCLKNKLCRDVLAWRSQPEIGLRYLF